MCVRRCVDIQRKIFPRQNVLRHIQQIFRHPLVWSSCRNGSTRSRCTGRSLTPPKEDDHQIRVLGARRTSIIGRASLVDAPHRIRSSTSPPDFSSLYHGARRRHRWVWCATSLELFKFQRTLSSADARVRPPPYQPFTRPVTATYAPICGMAT